VYTKIIKSGNILEFYEYQKAPYKQRYHIRKSRASRSHKRLSRRADNLGRTKRNFERLVWSNLSRENPPVLLTLTMLQIMEIGPAFKELTAFFRRLRRVSIFGKSFRYIAVPEFQKRGAVHFHCLVWGFPKEALNERVTRYLQRQWLRGFCDLLLTDDHFL